MGYCVDMELRNVRFSEDNLPKVISVLKELNEEWHKKNDWCRFDKGLEDVIEIFEDIGFEVEKVGSFIGTFYEIQYFEREKLGDHERMFKHIAQYLEDCEIVYRGEDDYDWKQVVKDGKVTEVAREDI